MDYKFLEKMLKPVSNDLPCGIDIDESGDLYKIEILVQGEVETQFSEAVPPEWKKVIRDLEKLFDKTKDLWVVNYLLIGFAELDGLTGASTGIKFLYELLERYWDEIWPIIDLEDEDEPYRLRLSPIETLFDPNSHFVNLLKNATLCKSKKYGSFSYKDIAEYQKESQADKLKIVDDAIIDTHSEYLEVIRKQFLLSLEYSKKIDDFINNKAGEINNSSNTDKIIILMERVNSYIEKALSNSNEEVDCADGESDNATISESTLDKGNRTTGGVGKINSSSDVINNLEKICEWYKKNEPSSMIPFLIRRTIGLIDKPFDEIIKDIASNAMPQISELFKLDSGKGQENVDKSRQEEEDDYGSFD